MVRPERFELPTFWFVANNPREIINLAMGTTVAHGMCCKQLRGFW
jgi:hypothetical protein